MVFEKVREVAKQNRYLRALVFGWRSFRKVLAENLYTLDPRGRNDYYFADNSKNSNDLCIVLAGYKEDVWDDVFARLKAYVPDDMDVCICTSGKRVTRLQEMCHANCWSYLSTARNQVCDIQNIAISLHQNAKYIFKLDEDIFLTRYFFSNIRHRLMHPPKHYHIGFVGPIIPINGYCYVRLLKKLGLIEAWEKRFNPAYYTDTAHHSTDIWQNPQAARFMWGENQGKLRDIDALAEKLNNMPDEYSICNIRYSIGAIAFPRDVWEGMGGFPVNSDSGMGRDEEVLCVYCLLAGLAIVVDENTVVGHLSFGPQNKEMLEFYRNHRDMFALKG